MDYIELNISVNPDYVEILTAELAELGFESFLDTEQGVAAYISEDLFVENSILELKNAYQKEFDFDFQYQTIKQQNWNAIWESEYEPVIIKDTCLIRSTFHQIDQKYPYEIIINPKMSFGTGHHETTTLMIEHQLETNHHQKKVMDAGCGTGILAIMAEKLGAKTVKAFDIDEWAVNNSLENLALNHCQCLEVIQADISQIPWQMTFEIVLANINKNVLLNEIPLYGQYLINEGVLLLSGFYLEDEADIQRQAEKNGFELLSKKSRNNWLALKFIKKSSSFDLQ